MVGSLKRDDILSAPDITRELVHIPEWGGDVYVQGMSGTERDAFEASVVLQRGKRTQLNTENIRAKLVALTTCDENGVRLFSDADVKALGKKSAVALGRIFAVAQRLSGIGEEDIKELSGELEENPLEDLPSA